jgi:hypothetical protein
MLWGMLFVDLPAMGWMNTVFMIAFAKLFFFYFKEKNKQVLPLFTIQQIAVRFMKLRWTLTVFMISYYHDRENRPILYPT